MKLLLIALAAGVAILLFLRRASLRRSFEGLARRFRGVVRSRIPFGLPWVWFRYRDEPVQVAARTLLPRWGGRQTRWMLRWPDASLRLELQTAARTRSAPQVHRWQPLTLARPMGGAEASSTDPAAAQRILGDRFLWSLEQLAARSSPPWLHLRIEGGRFRLSVAGHLRNEKALIDLTLQVLRAYDVALLPLQTGIEVVESTAAVAERLMCPVCCTAIRGSPMICGRCQTPHCIDCWQYNGRCAVFGCGETRATGPAA